jgi:glycosyltransferase involved in cell wall biosynthesis
VLDAEAFPSAIVRVRHEFEQRSLFFMRLAFIVSHPVQYYVPIYRGLVERIREGGNAQKWEPERSGDSVRRSRGQRGNVEKLSALKVFYTWRDAGPARDVRFGKEFAWDIPLMEGYDFEVVPNTSSDPGTHHRKGLINPDLVERVKAWQPDAVHITGYNYVSHGQAIKELSKAGIPVIFRGDSHLLDDRGPWWKWWIKKSWLSRVYSRPQGFAYVGQNNRDYYRAFGVPERKLFPVPHTIDVGRFAEPHEELEAKALAWRRELGIPDDHFVFLYAAKLEPRKRPMELLEAFLAANIERATLLFVGSGELEEALRARVNTGHGLTRIKGRISPGGCADRTGQECSSPGIAYGPSTAQTPPVPGSRKGPPEEAENCELNTANSRGSVLFLEFQNQSAMPVVYRLGDALVLPSGYGETWGLAVNEAQACGRPSLVSDCVGCARDIIREGENGSIFRTDDWKDCVVKMKRMVDGGWRSKREAIRAGAWRFDTARGVEALLAGLTAASKGTGYRNRRP